MENEPRSGGHMERTVIRYILDWTEKNIYTDAGINGLVEEIGFSRSTVDLWFRRNSGMRLGEYLTRRRMSHAAMLLRMTVLPVTEIATLFHFHSSQNFARAFRKVTGVTPTQYRNQPEWLVSVLQKPLLMGVSGFSKAGECILPELTFSGSVYSFQDSFLPSGPEGHSVLKNVVVSVGKENKGKTGVAVKINPDESQAIGRNGILNVEMIVQSVGEEESDVSIVIPAGKYIQFRFTGSWDEHLVFSRLAYFCLAEQNIARRNSYDLVYFSVPEDAADDIRCQHYIPVTDSDKRPPETTQPPKSSNG